jgi:hypothetical protein
MAPKSLADLHSANRPSYQSGVAAAMSFYNTGNPVPSIDPRDLDDNAKKLDEAINSQEETWVDRLGATRKSIKGVENGLAVMQEGFDEFIDDSRDEFNAFLAGTQYEVPAAYTAGLSITRATQTVIVSGIVYRPIPGSLPFVTTTFAADSAKWTVLGDASLRQDLVSAAGALNVHHDSDSLATILNYRYNVKTAGIPTDGTDVTAQLQALAAKFANTGAVVELLSGQVKTTQTIVIEGFELRLGKKAAVIVSGTDQAAFYKGGLHIKPGGKLTGDGDVYTSGTMVPVFGSAFASRSCAVFVDGGDMDDNVTVYSHIFSCVKHTSGKVKVRMFGGAYRPFYSELSVDQPQNYEMIEQYNAGIGYKDKIASDFVIRDVRGIYIKATTIIKSKVSVGFNTAFSAKNGVWIEGDGLTTGAQFLNLYTHGDARYAGYYIDAAGNMALGHGAGTNIEVLNAPKWQNDANTFEPQGYNIAVAGGCHDAIINGIHTGNGGDPVIVVANSSRVVVGGVLDKGTVGVSVGEDGATSNDCIITSTIRNMSSAPVQFGTGHGLSLLGAKIYGEPTLASTIGSWSGPGEVKPVVRVMSEGNDITITNCTIQGYFNYLVVDRAGATGRLRVTDKDNTLSCPIIARGDIQRNKLHQKASSADFIRVLNDSDVTGLASVGEISLPAGGATFLASAINPLLADLSTMALGAGETIADIYAKYAITVYMKYVPGALSQQVKFGLASSATSSHVQATFFGVFGAAVAPVTNSIGGVLHPLVDGEWVPLDMPLSTIIYSGANPAALTHFVVLKSTNPTTYDLTITKPTLTYIGTHPR